MNDTGDQSILRVSGLSPSEIQSLLFAIDADPISTDAAGIGSTAMGDFGTTALLFLGTATVISGILSWVERQPTDVTVKLEILKLIKLDVSKKTTKADIEMAAAKAGVPIDPST